MHATLLHLVEVYGQLHTLAAVTTPPHKENPTVPTKEEAGYFAERKSLAPAWN